MRYRAGDRELARELVAFTSLDAAPGTLDGTQKIAGGAILILDVARLPVSIDETVDASYTRKGGTTQAVHSEWTFKLRLTGRSSVSSAPLAAVLAQATAQPLRAPVQDPDRERRRDLRMSAQMSVAKMLDVVGEYESGARPDHEFLVRAAAFLRLHPEAVPAMVSRFRSPRLTVRGRGFILDVLVEAGSSAAQKGMREALQTPEASARKTDFAMLVQRFTFVRNPDKESVAFLEKTWETARPKSDPSAAQGTAVALGAVVKHLTAQHQDAAAREVNERLRSELRAAPNPALRAALVSGLGNAARPEDVADISAVAADPDGRVRNEAAHALRSVDSADARQTLLAMVTDSNAGVAAQAFGSLSQQSLSDSDWRALSDIAVAGKMPSSSDAALVNLVRAHGPLRTESRRILTALLRRNQGGDNDLPVIIRGLLASGD
jgi:HEAT repeat protein